MYNGVKGYLRIDNQDKGFDVEYQIDPTTRVPKTFIDVEMNKNFDSIWRLMNAGDKASLIANGMNEIYELELHSKPSILKYANKKYATISYEITNIKKC